MTYRLRVLFGRRDIADQAGTLGLGEVIELPQGFAMLLLTHDDYPVDDDTHIVDDNFHSLTREIEQIGVGASRSGPIAYLEVELFGGTGQQASIVWRDGNVVLGPLLSDNEYGQLEEPISERAVNRALRYLGVDRGDEFDEFEALGLGRHRGTEERLPGYKEDWLDDDDVT